MKNILFKILNETRHNIWINISLKLVCKDNSISGVVENQRKIIETINTHIVPPLSITLRALLLPDCSEEVFIHDAEKQ